MEATVTKKLNATTQIVVKAEGENLEQVLFQISPIINAPNACGKCQGVDITLTTKSMKKGEFQYIQYECKSCGAKQLFGHYKVPKGTFFLKEWEERYTGEQQG